MAPNKRQVRRAEDRASKLVEAVVQEMVMLTEIDGRAVVRSAQRL
jgi:hypothetical protein